jgi:hypothetical protein
VSDVSQGPDWYLASDGRWYPPESRWTAPSPSTYGPAPAPARRRRVGCLYALLGTVGVIVVAGITAVVVLGLFANKVHHDLVNGNLGGPAPAAAYKVGDTAKTGPFTATVSSVKDPQPSSNLLFQPRAGDHYVSADVQVTNSGTAQQFFSSLVAFHLIDGANHSYGGVFGDAGLSPGPPDGLISGGQSVRGFVAFEVPDGTAGLKLRIQGSLTASGVVFDLG